MHASIFDHFSGLLVQAMRRIYSYQPQLIPHHDVEPVDYSINPFLGISSGEPPSPADSIDNDKIVQDKEIIILYALVWSLGAQDVET